ncbi:MAG: TlpA disulfide reductase family protein [Cyclobacteriaceae bacterium]
MKFWKQNKRWLEPVLWVTVAGTLYLTGYHVEVIGRVQGLLLYTGLMKPDLEQEAAKVADLDFPLIDMQDHPILLSDHKGKVLFLNFWATWCPPCVAEMPGIARLYEDVGSDNVSFVLISSDKDREKLQAFIERKDFDDLPVYQVPPYGGGLPGMYRTGSIPSTFVIDKKGHIRMVREGMADFDTEEFRQFLARLASES